MNADLQERREFLMILSQSWLLAASKHVKNLPSLTPNQTLRMWSRYPSARTFPEA
jgi:hypothetical protein